MIESELRRSLDQNQFELYFQPKVGVNPDRLVGCEALVRWHHPELGMVPPDKFIPIAESCGLILPLGEWILRAAMRQIKLWSEQGLFIPVAINLSGRQFLDPMLSEKIERLLHQHGLPGAAIEFEITESTLMGRGGEDSAHTLSQLGKLGASIAIDDFGTGYSSLAYLKKYRVDTLKIDKSFIRDVGEEASDTAIVSAVILLAHELGMKVVAEGVETSDQATLLEAIGCDMLQGYFYSAPLCATDFLQYIRSSYPDFLQPSKKNGGCRLNDALAFSEQ
jgi:EAL domain-containing protein (putative c-di-GMP-specific phosphodiesterase class I)